MTSVYKYRLPTTINSIPGGEILKIAFQSGWLTAWVMLHHGAPDQVLEVVPTGVSFEPGGLEFIDTAVSDEVVLHVFRRRS